MVIQQGDLNYLSGFGSEFSTEALPGALPAQQNHPQKAPYGLYYELLSGSAFTAVRTENRRVNLYRILPSVKHGRFERVRPDEDTLEPASPAQIRWNALAYPDTPTDFVDGLHRLLRCGDSIGLVGCGVSLYSITASMNHRYYYSSDGELLIVPQEGRLRLKTELGTLDVGPTEIAVIPRGMRFQVLLTDTRARGYLCENYGQPLRLPHPGAIGPNGLANPRHFLTPTAQYEEKTGAFELFTSFQGNLWKAKIDHSPLDVVAWSGNYVPYKYDLKLFTVVNSVSHDHMDPSIFTVLTSPHDPVVGTANIDFVIFPPRWIVAENTFRPPYYHRNCMSEYMGLIHGTYDAKTASTQSGDTFAPGGGSLHNRMSGHGPDAATYENASQTALKPEKLDSTLAFMFESCFPYRLTAFAESSTLKQPSYEACWSDLRSTFNSKKK